MGLAHIMPSQTGSVILVSAWNLISKKPRAGVTKSDQLLFSVLAEGPRARTRMPGYPAVVDRSLNLDRDVLHFDRTRGLPLDPGNGRPTHAMSVRHRPRLSRIPDRLCGPAS